MASRDSAAQRAATKAGQRAMTIMITSLGKMSVSNRPQAAPAVVPAISPGRIRAARSSRVFSVPDSNSTYVEPSVRAVRKNRAGAMMESRAQ